VTQTFYRARLSLQQKRVLTSVVMRFLSSLKGWLFWLDIVCFFASLLRSAWLSFAYFGHNYLHTYIPIYYQQNAGTYKNDSSYQKMYTICLSKYSAILFFYCLLPGTFLLHFIDSTWILKTSWAMDHAMTTCTFKIFCFF
jgi:hypothetical protein